MVFFSVNILVKLLINDIIHIIDTNKILKHIIDTDKVLRHIIDTNKILKFLNGINLSLHKKNIKML